MQIRQTIADFFTGGERVKAAHTTKQALSKVKKPSDKQLEQLLEAQRITRRHFLKLGATGTAVLALPILLTKKLLEEKNPVLRTVLNTGGSIIRVQENSSVRDNLYLLGQLHRNPAGEQIMWDEYHELFKLVAGLHRNNLMNKVHFESIPFNQRAQIFPLDLSRRDVVDKVINDKNFFKTLLEARRENGQRFLNLETLLSTCFPNLEVTGIENPETFEAEYVGYMERVYEPIFRRLHPFHIASRECENHEFEQASFITPVFEGGRFTSVRAGSRNFNTGELLRNMTDWENAERHVAEQSRLREKFIMENIKDGFVVIGFEHLFNVEREHTETNSNIHLLFHKGTDINFLRNSDRAISNMRTNVISKLRTWMNDF